MVDEEYDFALPKNRMHREPVRAFRELLMRDETQQGLRDLGMTAGDPA